MSTASQLVTRSYILAEFTLITRHFSGPVRAVGLVCVRGACVRTVTFKLNNLFS